MSARAQAIYDAVVAAMQAADEIGGVDSDTDYLLLMCAIATEARRRTAAVQAK